MIIVQRKTGTYERDDIHDPSSATNKPRHKKKNKYINNNFKISNYYDGYEVQVY